MNKRQRKKRWKRLAAQRAAVVSNFIMSQLGRSSFVPQILVPVALCAVGGWADARGVVHVVSARMMQGGVDLGRETMCCSASWDPDNPQVYPVLTEADVDCMTCIVRLARSCPP